MNEKVDYLIKVYEEAMKNAEEATDWKEKIKAYDSVIEFCQSNHCIDESMTHNMILYWVYTNLGDICSENGEDNDAIIYYKNAIVFATGYNNRIEIAKKAADIFKKRNDTESFMEMVRIILNDQGDLETINQYIEMAKKNPDPRMREGYLDKAWKMADCASKDNAKECQLISDMLETARYEAVIADIAEMRRKA